MNLPLITDNRILIPMKYLTFLLLLTLAFSCETSTVSAQNGKPTVGKVNPKSPLQQDAADKDRTVAAMILRMGEATVGKGEIVCLPVETSGFNKLLGFQYTLRFDSTALKFHSVRKLGLPGYRVDNFGVRFADRGYLSTLWTAEDMVNGTSLKDETKLYEVCFENLQPSKAETEVKFQNGPTAFEVISSDMSKLRLVYSNGKVRSK